ncbi:uncharacterized protein LOC119993097 isoform X3 [Tripterygium wilfordii]|uniref:uncharacterized protein LOC119993097 isoform X3 n=1 Tax=Tripterygium wilfordii TaxID=458696 RepID=UPI0018F845C2|nr:uncharacterized protein LOC119993097 isoform X3 [Tripterygium wilfordii]
MFQPSILELLVLPLLNNSTRYGTIPTEPVAPSRQQIAKERIQSSIGTPRSWKEMVQLQSLNIPSNLNESVERIRTNALLAATIVMLSVTSVTDKIVMALSTGVVVVLVHGALRTTNDLVVVDPELGGEGTNTPLRDAASASYSLSM